MNTNDETAHPAGPGETAPTRRDGIAYHRNNQPPSHQHTRLTRLADICEDNDHAQTSGLRQCVCCLCGCQRFLICPVRCSQQSHTLALRQPTLDITAAPPHSARARTPEPHRLREVAALYPAPKSGPGKTDHIQHVFGSQD